MKKEKKLYWIPVIFLGCFAFLIAFDFVDLIILLYTFIPLITLLGIIAGVYHMSKKAQTIPIWTSVAKIFFILSIIGILLMALIRFLYFHL